MKLHIGLANVITCWPASMNSWTRLQCCRRVNGIRQYALSRRPRFHRKMCENVRQKSNSKRKKNTTRKKRVDCVKSLAYYGRAYCLEVWRMTYDESCHSIYPISKTQCIHSALHRGYFYTLPVCRRSSRLAVFLAMSREIIWQRWNRLFPASSAALVTGEQCNKIFEKNNFLDVLKRVQCSGLASRLAITIVIIIGISDIWFAFARYFVPSWLLQFPTNFQTQLPLLLQIAAFLQIFFRTALNHSRFYWSGVGVRNDCLQILFARRIGFHVVQVLDWNMDSNRSANICSDRC